MNDPHFCDHRKETLQKDHPELHDRTNFHRGGRVETEAHLMEQLFITRKMQEEMTTLLKKHEGHASRVIRDAMNDNGVDENVYQKKSIDGNYCIKFGDK